MTDHDDHKHGSDYKKGSLTLTGSIAMGTGVMIGAGNFALTGQVAKLTGGLFPVAFIAAALVVAFSAYSYIKVCNEYPSAGGIAMNLKKAYGPGVVTAGCSLLMYFSMVINESLVARTFGTYTMRIFGEGSDSWLVPALGVGLIVAAFVVNLMGNQVIGGLSKVTAIIKIVDIAVFAGIGLWVSGLSFDTLTGDGASSDAQGGIAGFLAAVVLGAFLYLKLTTDPLVVGVGLGSMALILGLEAVFIAQTNSIKEVSDDDEHTNGHADNQRHALRRMREQNQRRAAQARWHRIRRCFAAEGRVCHLRQPIPR